MEQLVERVHAALADEYPGAPNGRVRELPDRRSIRWYSTIGLVDRPLGTRGRVALYGPRHLLQLVAIKRRQAAGRTLAEIQVELTGASDEALSAAARVPAELLTAEPPPTEGPVRTEFWRDSPAPPAPADRTTAPSAAPDDTGLVLTGVPLGMGVILLVPHALDHVDRGDLAAAARPLLDLLASRGLTVGRDE
ncbi:MerR family transcriptional regulator [Actinoplanes sp. NPDC024001]|uniref:MerR family transcriptional regulator n=1 Tax=Actinoplanes sp. NPDC024001 TaxID=3154598 RepID=UPI00340B4EDF